MEGCSFVSKVIGLIGRFKAYADGSGAGQRGGRGFLTADDRDTQLNRLETDRSSLIRRIASPISGAIVSWRILWAARTASVATMLSVMTSVSIGEAATRDTAGPDNTPWVT